MAERKESLTKMTEDGISRTTQIESKYVYRWGCASILVFLATLLFFLYWYPFVAGHNNTGSLLGKGNLTMAAGIYAALYLVIGRGTGAFQIGVDRISNVMAAQAMTLFTVDFLEIFISMAITGQFRYFLSPPLPAHVSRADGSDLRPGLPHDRSLPEVVSSAQSAGNLWR